MALARDLRASWGVAHFGLEEARSREDTGRPAPMGKCAEKDAGEGGIGATFW